MPDSVEGLLSPSPMDRLVAETKASLMACLQTAGITDEKVLQEFVADDILLRPPFGFIHALVRMLATSEKVMFASNLYSAEELGPPKGFSRTDKLRFLMKILACVASVTGERVDIFVSPAKVITGEEVDATLHFLQTLARAASTESLIQASISASEEVLKTGISDIYKKCVRVRNAICRMQSLWRERRALAYYNGLVEAAISKPPPSPEASAELVSLPPITNDTIPTEQQFCLDSVQKDGAEATDSGGTTPVSEQPKTDVVSEEANLSTVNSAATESHSESLQSDISNKTDIKENKSGHLPCDQGIECQDGAVRDKNVSTNQRSVSEPTGGKVRRGAQSPKATNIAKKSSMEDEGRIKLEQDRKKLFSLQYKVRQTMKQLMERDAALQAREASLQEKDVRIERLARHLKRQQARIVQVQMKEHELLEQSKQDGGEDGKCKTANEERILLLQEREERIVRLEEKLRKAQLRLLKKQQQQDLASAMCQVSPALQLQGGTSTEMVQGEKRETKSRSSGIRKQIKTAPGLPNQCSQYVQTDKAADFKSSVEKRTEMPVEPELTNSEPFFFCFDSRVLYPMTLRKKSDASSDSGSLMLRPRASRRRHCSIGVTRKRKTSDTKQIIQSKNENCVEQVAQLSLAKVTGGKCVRFEQSEESGKEDLEDQQDCVAHGSPNGDLSNLHRRRELVPRNASTPAVPATLPLRDVVSVATKSQASSFYSGYKFSFDWDKPRGDKIQKASAARNQSKKSRAHVATINRYSQWLENFDQQIQGALNNM